MGVNTFELCRNHEVEVRDGLGRSRVDAMVEDISLKSENTRGKGAEVEEDQTEDKTEAGKPPLH